MKETVVKLPFRLRVFTTLMITGLTAAATSLALAPAVSASPTPAPAAPGTKLWSANLVGIGGFSEPSAMAASPNGSAVFVTGFTGGLVSGHDSYATVGYNALTGAKLWRAIFHQAPKRRPSNASDVAVSPDGSTVFVTGTTPKGTATVAYNAATGAKVWVADTSVVAGTGLAVSPDGSTLFVTGYNAQTPQYALLAYSTASGTLLWTATYPGTQLGFGENTPKVAVSPDGSTVFLEGESGFASLTIAYKATTGARLWTRSFSGLGQAGASGLVVSPDSSRVFVTGNSGTSSSPVSFATVAYDATTGAQQWVQYDAGLSPTQFGRTGDNSIAIAPDGSTVFVTGENTEANGTGGYSTIAYDAATGAKLWQQRYFANGTGGEAAEAWFAGVSPDGSEVFVTGLTHSGHFATLGYNSATGAQLWLAVDRHTSCANAIGAANPATPEVIVTGTCDTGREGVQDYKTVAYSG